MNSTITDQMDQMEKPTCSAKIDQIRLRLAIFFPAGLPPWPSHASTSSASQCSILRSRVNVVTGTSQRWSGLQQVYVQPVPLRLHGGIRYVKTSSHPGANECATVFTADLCRQ